MLYTAILDIRLGWRPPSPQTVRNACGTIAVLHALGNNLRPLPPGARRVRARCRQRSSAWLSLHCAMISATHSHSFEHFMSFSCIMTSSPQMPLWVFFARLFCHAYISSMETNANIKSTGTGVGLILRISINCQGCHLVYSHQNDDLRNIFHKYCVIISSRFRRATFSKPSLYFS